MKRAASASSEPLRIAMGQDSVSGLVLAPRKARACVVLAHGAGAGMSHPFMNAVAAGLCGEGVASLRYQFPYMERGSRRPDPPALAQATVRAAVDAARTRFPDLPLFASGKSFGGRMTSQAQAAAALSGVHGLVFPGFPLHAPGKPGRERGAHLASIGIPLLFLQGTRDQFADLALLRPLVAELGSRATLQLFEDADHSFHVPARSGHTDAEIMNALVTQQVSWMGKVMT